MWKITIPLYSPPLYSPPSLNFHTSHKKVLEVSQTQWKEALILYMFENWKEMRKYSLCWFAKVKCEENRKKNMPWIWKRNENYGQQCNFKSMKSQICPTSIFWCILSLHFRPKGRIAKCELGWLGSYLFFSLT